MQYRLLELSVTLIYYCPSKSTPDSGPSGVLGIWGEWLFIFRELGTTGVYLRGGREQAHNFGNLGSLAKKQKKNI